MKTPFSALFFTPQLLHVVHAFSVVAVCVDCRCEFFVSDHARLRRRFRVGASVSPYLRFSPIDVTCVKGSLDERGKRLIFAFSIHVTASPSRCSGVALKFGRTSTGTSKLEDGL